MNTYKPIKYQASIDYPSLDEVRAYTELYRVSFMNRDNPNKGWHKFTHSDTLEVLTIGGLYNYYLVYLYPPAGFTIAHPEDLLPLETWRGIILEYRPVPEIYRLDTYTPRDGIPFFKQRKTELGY